MTNSAKREILDCLMKPRNRSWHIAMNPNSHSDEPTHLDLFSGIGGFALAARWAGFRTIGFCEIDKYCQKVLAKNFGAIANAAGDRQVNDCNQRKKGGGQSSHVR